MFLYMYSTFCALYVDVIIIIVIINKFVIHANINRRIRILLILSVILFYGDHGDAKGEIGPNLGPIKMPRSI